MKIDTEYASPLVLKRFLVPDSSLSCSEDIGKIEQGKFRIEHKLEDEGDNVYKLTLETLLIAANAEIRVYVKMVAWFETEIKDPLFIRGKGIEIIFPYVRSYISSLFLGAGMQPLVLPVISPLAMMQDFKGRLKNTGSEG